VTIVALPSGIPRCNTAAAPAGDETAAHSLSADTAAAAVAVLVGQPLDSRDDM
jgi:hypothetical protein